MPFSHLVSPPSYEDLESRTSREELQVKEWNEVAVADALEQRLQIYSRRKEKTKPLFSTKPPNSNLISQFQRESNPPWSSNVSYLPSAFSKGTRSCVTRSGRMLWLKRCKPWRGMPHES